MALKEFFRIEKIKKNNIPKVIFEDIVLQIGVGEWLFLSPPKSFFGQNVSEKFYTLSEIEQLMKDELITDKTLDKIVKKFGIVLKCIGVSEKEICVLNKLDKTNCSFNCHFKKSNTDAYIYLKFGDGFEVNDLITIDYNGESKTYAYFPDNGRDPDRLKFESYSIRNTKTDNVLTRNLSAYRMEFKLQNYEYTLSIDIGIPDNMAVNLISDGDYAFEFKREEELKQFFVSLTFPIEIDKVYRKICELSDFPIKQFPKVAIQVESRYGKVTDRIVLHDGCLIKDQLLITRNGRTIDINDLRKIQELEARMEATKQEMIGEIPVDKYVLDLKEVRQLVKTMFPPRN